MRLLHAYRTEHEGVWNASAPIYTTRKDRQVSYSRSHESRKVSDPANRKELPARLQTPVRGLSNVYTLCWVGSLVGNIYTNRQYGYFLPTGRRRRVRGLGN